MRTTTLITFIGLTLALACNPIAPEVSESEPELVRREFTATLDSSTGTRTSLDGTHVLWDASGETIGIVNQNGSVYQASQTSVSDDRRKASFAGDVPESGNLYAVYPSDLCSGYSNGRMSITVPSVQTPVANGFATGTSPTVATINAGEALYMRNICGMVGFSVNCSGVKSILFSATESNGGAMTGAGELTYEGNDPVCTTQASAGACQVELKGDIEPGVQYWALVYPGTYTNLKIVFTDAGGRTATITSSKQLVLGRNRGSKFGQFTITDGDWDGGEPVIQTATLTYSEASGSVGGYNNPQSYTNQYGTWTICAYKDNAMQINKGKVAYIGTPLFDGIIQSVAITLASGSNSSGNFYICSSPGDTNAPSDSFTKACAGTETVIDVSSLGLCQLWIRSSFGVKISKIVITWLESGASQKPKVTTLAATDVATADATLNASFSGIPTNPDPTAAFFRWGTSASALANELYDNQTILNTSNGSFCASLTGLQESTTYYYQAVMTLANGTDVEGDVMSFTTRSSQQSNAPGHLACYEVPAVDVSGSVVSGNEKFGAKWYKYYTTNSRRAVATHTFKYNNRTLRNYTVMMDADKKSPVWCATAFNSNTWPRINSGRKGDWKLDPAFPESWQQENATGSYSRGHFIASNYCQTTDDQNKQTFYISNQAAQWQTGFNDGVWNQLENRVVSMIPSGSDTLYVVVGVLFEGSDNIKNGIHIPSHFYKCIMKCSFSSGGSMTSATGCAYLFENRAYSDSYSNHKTTIDAIEERSGIDFFHNVPDDLEEAAENTAGSPI